MRKILTHQETTWVGPIPPPEILGQYNNAIHNGAERILAMAERQSAHRESLERRVVEGNVANQTRASWFAFIIVLVTIACGSWLIHEGKDTLGMAAILAPLAGIIGVFFYARREQRKERIEKSSSLANRRKA